MIVVYQQLQAPGVSQLRRKITEDNSERFCHILNVSLLESVLGWKQKLFRYLRIVKPPLLAQRANQSACDQPLVNFSPDTMLYYSKQIDNRLSARL